MDLRVYFQKIRDVEAKIPGPYTTVVSVATPDGGRAGVLTDVPRRVAAKMVVDGTAKLASDGRKESSKG